MPNGSELNEELEFEHKIKGMADRQLLEFTARQVYDVSVKQSDLSMTCAQIPVNTGRIAALESGSRKSSAVAGGISGTTFAILIGIMDWFLRRGS